MGCQWVGMYVQVAILSVMIASPASVQIKYVYMYMYVRVMDLCMSEWIDSLVCRI